MYRTLALLVFVVVGLVLGVLVTLMVVGTQGGGQATKAGQAGAAQKWICSMHPQIVMDHPDKCPLCGMDLEPVGGSGGAEGAEESADTLTLSEHARKMATVATSPVRRLKLFKELRTVGKVELDETRAAHIAARVDGRVDQVFADFPGTPVRKGEHLVSIYSPDLFSTQEELLLAHRREQAQKRPDGPDLLPSLAASSRRRLLLWGVTDQQIDEMLQSGKVQTYLVVYAPIGGTVIEKKIRPGQYVKQGDLLYTIADLSQVWLVIDVYESELSWIRFGQAVQVTLESEPTRPVTGTVGFVEPVLNEATRTVRVRVILDNRSLRLKPGMYAQALVKVPILPDGSPAPTGLEGKYACPMHPYVVADQPGDCNVCGMPLEQVPGKPAPGGAQSHPGVLAVPAEAVLTTGRRQLVYVEDQPGHYRLVEPKLGPRTGEYFPVLAGLEEGQRVVTRGNFLLDSQFQITGKMSLLYPEGAAGAATGHAGHGPGAPTASGAGAGAAGQRPPEFSLKEWANLNKLSAEDREAAVAQRVCPITGAKLGSMGVPPKMTIGSRTLFLCCKGCEAAVKSDPEAALEKIKAAGPRPQPP
jgi:Cu(I)/Ag(I) efflux system membrane fusion protein